MEAQQKRVKIAIFCNTIESNMSEFPYEDAIKLSVFQIENLQNLRQIRKLAL